MTFRHDDDDDDETHDIQDWLFLCINILEIQIIIIYLIFYH